VSDVADVQQLGELHRHRQQLGDRLKHGYQESAT
jgi:hypothetical protein